MYTDMYIYIYILFFLCVGQAILSRAGPFIWESLSFIYQTEAAKMEIGVILSLSTPMWERLLVSTGRYWEVLVADQWSRPNHLRHAPHTWLLTMTPKNKNKTGAKMATGYGTRFRGHATSTC